MERLQIETIIIGGGQAGLATSYHLLNQSQEHLVLERADRPAHVWHDERWDSFTLVIPNWGFQLPGAEYNGPDPQGFMPRHDIVAAFERYYEKYRLPVRFGVNVTSVEARPDGKGYLVSTPEQEFKAMNVVIATGMFQHSRIPAFSTSLPAGIHQLTSAQYRNPAALPSGAVLVVGSAQSGSQIADELLLSGRQVYLCVGKSGRAPRRYRGKDIFDWLMLSGFMDRTLQMLPDPQARFLGSVAVSGRDGGKSLNVHQFARDGIQLLGHLQGSEGQNLYLAPDLHHTLAQLDQSELDILKIVDNYIQAQAIPAPEEQVAQLRDGYLQPEITSLNLKAAGISSLIWASGFTPDFSMVRLPVLDGHGLPITQRGATDFPGLYFIGLPWLYKLKSGFLFGVSEDAQHIADLITSAA